MKTEVNSYIASVSPFQRSSSSCFNLAADARSCSNWETTRVCSMLRREIRSAEPPVRSGCLDKNCAVASRAGANGACYEDMSVYLADKSSCRTLPCVNRWIRSRHAFKRVWISFDRALFSGSATSRNRSMQSVSSNLVDTIEGHSLMCDC